MTTPLAYDQVEVPPPLPLPWNGDTVGGAPNVNVFPSSEAELKFTKPPDSSVAVPRNT